MPSFPSPRTWGLARGGSIQIYPKRTPPNHSSIHSSGIPNDLCDCSAEVSIIFFPFFFPFPTDSKGVGPILVVVALVCPHHEVDLIGIGDLSRSLK